MHKETNMLMQNDPFFEALFRGTPRSDTHRMPMDAYRRGDDVWVHIDLPGVASDSLDISVERNVLTVSADRNWQREEGDQAYLTERSQGSYRRQVHLGDALDADAIEADLADGVLTLRIPVSERAQPRKITVGTRQKAIDVESVAS
jgi:HSP20 family protein